MADSNLSASGHSYGSRGSHQSQASVPSVSSLINKDGQINNSVSSIQAEVKDWIKTTNARCKSDSNETKSFFTSDPVDGSDDRIDPKIHSPPPPKCEEDEWMDSLQLRLMEFSEDNDVYRTMYVTSLKTQLQSLADISTSIKLWQEKKDDGNRKTMYKLCENVVKSVEKAFHWLKSQFYHTNVTDVLESCGKETSSFEVYQGDVSDLELRTTSVPLVILVKMANFLASNAKDLLDDWHAHCADLCQRATASVSADGVDSSSVSDLAGMISLGPPALQKETSTGTGATDNEGDVNKVKYSSSTAIEDASNIREYEIPLGIRCLRLEVHIKNLKQHCAYLTRSPFCGTSYESGNYVWTDTLKRLDDLKRVFELLGHHASAATAPDASTTENVAKNTDPSLPATMETTNVTSRDDVSSDSDSDDDLLRQTTATSAFNYDAAATDNALFKSEAQLLNPSIDTSKRIIMALKDLRELVVISMVYSHTYISPLLPNQQQTSAIMDVVTKYNCAGQKVVVDFEDTSLHGISLAAIRELSTDFIVNFEKRDYDYIKQMSRVEHFVPMRARSPVLKRSSQSSRSASASEEEVIANDLVGGVDTGEVDAEEKDIKFVETLLFDFVLPLVVQHRKNKLSAKVSEKSHGTAAQKEDEDGSMGMTYVCYAALCLLHYLVKEYKNHPMALAVTSKVSQGFSLTDKYTQILLSYLAASNAVRISASRSRKSNVSDNMMMQKSEAPSENSMFELDSFNREAYVISGRNDFNENFFLFESETQVHNPWDHSYISLCQDKVKAVRQLSVYLSSTSSVYSLAGFEITLDLLLEETHTQKKGTLAVRVANQSLELDLREVISSLCTKNHQHERSLVHLKSLVECPVYLNNLSLTLLTPASKSCVRSVTATTNDEAVVPPLPPTTEEEDNLVVESLTETPDLPKLRDLFLLIDVLATEYSALSQYSESIQLLLKWVYITTKCLKANLPPDEEEDEDAEKTENYTTGHENFSETLEKLEQSISLETQPVVDTKKDSEEELRATPEWMTILQQCQYRCIVHLASLYLNDGSPEACVLMLQSLLRTLLERDKREGEEHAKGRETTDTKVSVLLLLCQAYLDFEDVETATRLIDIVKNVRTEGNASRQLVKQQLLARAGESNSYRVGGLRKEKRTQQRSELSKDRSSDSGEIVSALETDETKTAPSFNASDYDSLYGASTWWKENKSEDSIWSEGPLLQLYSLNETYVDDFLHGFSYFAPKCCPQHLHFDLGYAQAVCHYKNKDYTAAMKSLVPTLNGVEIFIEQNKASHNALLDLAKLYDLRGKIGFAASKRTAQMSFPFTIDGQATYNMVNNVYNSLDLESDKTGYKGEDLLKAHHPTQYRRGRNTIQYGAPSDVMRDTIQWFEGSLQLFGVLGLDLYVAKVAHQIAQCHLEVTFVPCAFFGASKVYACDLSPPLHNASTNRGGEKAINIDGMMGLSGDMSTGLGGSAGGGLDGLFSASPSTSTVNSSSADTSSITFSSAQVGEASLKMSTDLDPTKISLSSTEAFITKAINASNRERAPLLWIESQLDKAELKFLMNDSKQANFHWEEARKLFQDLFVYKTSVPLARRANLRILNKIRRVLNRIVRYLWTTEKEVFNQHLLLLDLYLEFDTEVERVTRRYSYFAVNYYKRLKVCLDMMESQKELIKLVKFQTSSGVASVNIDDIPVFIPGQGYQSRQDRQKEEAKLPPPKKEVFSRIFVFPKELDPSNSDPAERFTPLRAHVTHIPGEDLDTTIAQLNQSTGTPESALAAQLAERTNRNIYNDKLSDSKVSALWATFVGLYHTQNINMKHLQEAAGYKLGHQRRNLKTNAKNNSTLMTMHKQMLAINRPSTVQNDTSFFLDSFNYDAFQDISTKILISQIQQSQQTEMYDGSNQPNESNAARAVADCGMRILRVLYAVKIDDLLMMYHPNMCQKNVQLFDCCNYVMYQDANTLLERFLEPLHKNPEKRGFNAVQGIINVRFNEVKVPTMPGRAFPSNSSKGMDSNSNLGNSNNINNNMDYMKGNGQPQRPSHIPTHEHGSSFGNLRSGAGDFHPSCLRNVGIQSECLQYMHHTVLASDERQCCGGAEGRKALWSKSLMSDPVIIELRRFIHFVSNPKFYEYVMSTSVMAHDRGVQRTHMGQQGGIGNFRSFTTMVSRRLNLMLHGSGIVKDEDRYVPLMNVPLTLFCSSSLRSLPWELLPLPYDTLLRGHSLVQVFNPFKRTSGFMGPKVGAKPVYVGSAIGLTGMPVKLRVDLQSIEGLRRELAIDYHIDLLHRNIHRIGRRSGWYNGMKRPPPFDIDNTRIPKDIINKYRAFAKSFWSQEWPYVLPLLPLGKTSTQALRSKSLRKVLFTDLSDFLALRLSPNPPHYGQLHTLPAKPNKEEEDGRNTSSSVDASSSVLESGGTIANDLQSNAYATADKGVNKEKEDREQQQEGAGLVQEQGEQGYAEVQGQQDAQKVGPQVTGDQQTAPNANDPTKYVAYADIVKKEEPSKLLMAVKKIGLGEADLMALNPNQQYDQYGMPITISSSNIHSSYEFNGPKEDCRVHIPDIFHVVILTYIDLIECSSSVNCLLASKEDDSIYIFAPHFCVSQVAKEVVRSMDLYYQTTRSNEASLDNHMTGMDASPYGDSMGHDMGQDQYGNYGGMQGMQLDPMSIQRQQNQNHVYNSRQYGALPQGHGIQSHHHQPSKKPQYRHIYHVIMDVVKRIQETQMTNISVYM